MAAINYSNFDCKDDEDQYAYNICYYINNNLIQISSELSGLKIVRDRVQFHNITSLFAMVQVVCRIQVEPFNSGVIPASTKVDNSKVQVMIIYPCYGRDLGREEWKGTAKRNIIVETFTPFLSIMYFWRLCRIIYTFPNTQVVLLRLCSTNVRRTHCKSNFALSD